jgi:NAD(P)-dependent dehydrogenase (short-subunit alcohol dehydrogenase family)/acyl dehydratase/putative sterol carrier protein
MGQLEGQVVLITGAGQGIGRSHALALAREGAKLVINDPGVARDGEGSDHKAADKVVAELREVGAEALANYDSVATAAGADAMVAAAIERFGRLDAVINNAGILRDKTLIKLDDADWQLVIDVHLKGTFLVTRAFARHVKERAENGQMGGRIVNTSSYAGLIGNFGQTNYSAAKAGIAGLTRSWALELARYGVTVNAIAPMAKTRMTEDIPVISNDMRPEQISPMVAYLLSPESKDITGRIFGIHGQQIFEYQMLMTEGVTKPGADLWAIDEIHAAMPRISAAKKGAAISEPTTPQKPAPAAPVAAPAVGPEALIHAAFSAMPKIFVPEKAKGWSAVLHFLVSGAGDWTLTIKDGRCESAQGLKGEPSCKVSTDARTWADIVSGQTKADKAFMSGKIQASNLSDMMKLGSAFDLSKAAALLAQASAPASATSQAVVASPAAPASSPSQMVAAAFSAMPKIFVPEKAKGWSAVLHFLVSGAGDWTLTIKDGRCESAQGLKGEPSCKVSTDARTWADIVSGQTKADKAFMSGKIQASNLSDMMKLGTAFDLSKAAALLAQASAASSPAAPAPAPAAPAPAAASPSSPQAIVDAAFARMPELFLADKAGKWRANIQFILSGGQDWCISIADGKCETKATRHESPTCTVRTDCRTWADVLTGKEKAEKAFMSGKIQADNLPDMMKLGGAFDLKRAAELIASAKSEAPAPAAAPAAPVKGLNREWIGRQIKAGHIFVEAADCKAYAEATNDPNPTYLDEGRAGGLIAPPLLPVRYLKDALFKILTDPDLGADMLRLVHGEQDMEFLQPLRPKDLLIIRAGVDGIEDKSSGQVLHVGARFYRDGELVTRIRSSMFIRAPKSGESGSSKSRAEAPKARANPDLSDEVIVSADQSLRYADASLDNNPIHTDLEVARLAGLPDIILQGLCTMAFASRALVQHAAAGDPARLKRLRVRFSKPVLPGQRVRTEAWLSEASEGKRHYELRAVNEKGEEVLSQGLAIVQ